MGREKKEKKEGDWGAKKGEPGPLCRNVKWIAAGGKPSTWVIARATRRAEFETIKTKCKIPTKTKTTKQTKNNNKQKTNKQKNACQSFPEMYSN